MGVCLYQLYRFVAAPFLWAECGGGEGAGGSVVVTGVLGNRRAGGAVEGGQQQHTVTTAAPVAVRVDEGRSSTVVT